MCAYGDRSAACGRRKYFTVIYRLHNACKWHGRYGKQIDNIYCTDSVTNGVCNKVKQLSR